MNTHVNAPEIRDFPGAANLQESPSDKECFQAIDQWVREKEREWCALARACLEVQTRELWKHGDFHSWDEWLNSAAPRSARTIYWHISIVKGLEADFTDAELSQIHPGTAKVLRKLSTKARRDPALRAVTGRKPAAFTQTVKTLYPEEHIEDESMMAFSLSETQREIVEEEFQFWEKEDPEMSRGEILCALCIAAGEMRKSGRSV